MQQSKHKKIKLDFWKIIKKQRKDTLDVILTDTHSCDFKSMKTGVVSPKGINNIYKFGENDWNAMKFLSCSLSDYLSSDSKHNTFQIIKLRKLLGKLQKQHKGEIRFFLTSENENFFIKTYEKIGSTQEEEEDILIHEYFVGAYGTNSLRKDIPTFSYIPGIFTCGSIIRENLDVPYCSENNPIASYLIYENIKDSITLAKWNGTFEDMLNIIIQLLLALDTAYRQFRFTHYDLHIGNIMISEKETYIPYEIDGETLFLKTNYIASIIDYGMSYIEYKGKSYGTVENLMEYHIYPTVPYPMYDMFKLICTILMYNYRLPRDRVILRDDSTVIIKNAQQFHKLKKILKFFTSGGELEYEGKEYYIRFLTSYYRKYKFFQIHYTKEYREIHYVDLFNYIVTNYGEDIRKMFLKSKNSDPKIPIYGCGSILNAKRQDCKTDIELKKIGFIDISSTKEAFPLEAGFYSVVEYLMKNGYTDPGNTPGWIKANIVQAREIFVKDIIADLMPNLREMDKTDSKDPDNKLGIYEYVKALLLSIVLMKKVLGTLNYFNAIIDYIEKEIKLYEESVRINRALLRKYPDKQRFLEELKSVQYEQNKLRKSFFEGKIETKGMSINNVIKRMNRVLQNGKLGYSGGGMNVPHLKKLLKINGIGSSNMKRRELVRELSKLLKP